MQNDYFILRHGESLANAAGIILSHAEEGKKAEYTLTAKGEGQVRDSVLKAKQIGDLDHETIIVTSPFSRCVRSAEIAKEVLGAERGVVVDERLRERCFGDWEKTANTNYEKIWSDDRSNPAHTIANVESAEDVQTRTLALIEDLEHTYSGKTILLVSHGDALQILQTGLQKQSPSLHRSIEHLEVAEVRKLNPTG